MSRPELFTRVAIVLVLCAGLVPLTGAGCAPGPEQIVTSFLDACARGDLAGMKAHCVDTALAEINDQEKAIIALIQLEQAGYRAPGANESTPIDAANNSRDTTSNSTNGANTPQPGDAAPKFDFEFDLLPERNTLSEDGGRAEVTARLIRHGRRVHRTYSLVHTEAGWKIQSWRNSSDD